jgi:hypothetical protein
LGWLRAADYWLVGFLTRLETMETITDCVPSGILLPVTKSFSQTCVLGALSRRHASANFAPLFVPPHFTALQRPWLDRWRARTATSVQQQQHQLAVQQQQLVGLMLGIGM